MYLIRRDLWEIVTGDEIIADDISEAMKRKIKNVKTKRLLPFFWGFLQACKSTFVLQKQLKRHGKISKNIFNKKHCKKILPEEVILFKNGQRREYDGTHQLRSDFTRTPRDNW